MKCNEKYEQLSQVFHQEREHVDLSEKQPFRANIKQKNLNFAERYRTAINLRKL